LVATVPAVAVKFAVVAPAATVTEVGTVSAALFEESPTGDPPAKAARDKVTVQVVVAAEATEFGEQDKPEIAGGGGFTVTEAVAVPFNVAVTVTVWLLATVPAVAVKFAVVAPATTITDAGTVRAALFEESPTGDPPAGATADSVTVQLVVAPEATEPGEHNTLEIEVAGVEAMTVTAAVAVPFMVAVTVTFWLFGTVPAMPLKLAVVAPPDTNTDGGTVSAALLEESVTMAPFRDPVDGAGEFNVTVQVEVEPEVTEFGEHAKLETANGAGFTTTEAVAVPFRVAVTVAV